MIRSTLLLGLTLLLLSVSSSALQGWPKEQSQQVAYTFNANHIFNAIHSSMRQFGSSLHHNGMSYFIATVPADTHFYHGGNTSKPVTGREWLAFEPEHALMFSAQPPIPPLDMAHRRVLEQHVFGGTEDKTEEVHRAGYLHTYVTKHVLRLLYLDGQAAAKSAIGTMDTQDYVLVNQSIGRKRGSMGEFNRIIQMCQRANEEWKGNIDGIIRMEAGFELILCSFEHHLIPLRIAPVSSRGQDWFDDDDEFFSYYQAVTARYDGIGGNRVRIDYDDFVSAYTHKEADLFRYGSKPRLNSTDAAVLDSIREEIDRIARKFRQSAPLHDWQSVTDMIVARFAPRLAYATSPAMSSYQVLERQLDLMMKPFIDYDARNQKAEVQRCTEEYIPSDWSTTSTAAHAIRGVSHRICSTIMGLLHSDEINEKTLPTATKRLNELKDWLDWTIWKRCTGCEADEVCVVPMWPRGSLSDWEKPACLNKTEGRRHGGYWGPVIRQ